MALSLKKLVLLLFLLCLAGTVSPACLQQNEVAPRQVSAPPEKTTEIVIAAVGDVMMPVSIQATAGRSKYNYDLLFENIARDLAPADLVFANLETQVDHTAPISGYPKFNARPELLVELKKAGVGIVSVANNHAMDLRPGGLKRTINNIEKAGLRFCGGGRTRAEAEQATMVTVRGTTIAFLGYTYSTNQRMPSKKPTAPRVNILAAGSEDDLARAVFAVQQARQAADLVAVSLHWSDEYRTVPTAWQRRAAAELIEAGADVILGHHPHVLQPIESYTARNGRQGLIAFSLGNFISTQNYGITNGNRTHARALRGDGVILYIVADTKDGKTSVKRAEFLPIWTLRDRAGEAVVYRPVGLAREMARLAAIEKRTKEENDTLELLGFRNKFIIDQLMGKPAPL